MNFGSQPCTSQNRRYSNPATNLLTTKDIIYRLQSASISAVVCTADGDLTDYVDEAQKSCPELVTKFIVRGEKQGWLSYRDEMEAASEELARIENSKLDDMLLYFTSGTAGYPKMVVHNYAYPLAHIMTAKYWHNVGSRTGCILQSPKPDGPRRYGESCTASG